MRSLDDILAAAENRKGSRRWPGKRGLDQAKADIASLFFYDRLLLDGGVLGDTQRPDIQFVYMEPAEELYPLLDRILPSGWEVGAHPENQPEHFLPRAEVLGTLNTRKIPGIMHVTLDDDVVGLVPQLRPTVLHEFMTQLRRHGWTGFAARERFPADHDAVLAYLAEAGWNSEAEPDVVARDLIRTVCGEASVEDMLAALHLVESATLNLATNKINFSFYVPGMMMKFWNPEPKPAYLVELQQDYVQALEAARRALEKSRPEGRWYPDFWVGRIEFALGYANAVEAMGRGATVEAAGKRAEAAKHADEALSFLRGGLEAYVPGSSQPHRPGGHRGNERVWLPGPATQTDRTGQLRRLRDEQGIWSVQRSVVSDRSHRAGGCGPDPWFRAGPFVGPGFPRRGSDRG